MEALGILGQYVGIYRGEGINHEGEPFMGNFALEPILSGRGFQVKFEAKSIKNEGQVFHSEVSMIAHSTTGGLSLYNLNTNMPFLCEHRMETAQISEAPYSLTFRFGDLNDRQSFREEIRLECFPDGNIGYHYSWGMPDGDFAYRSGMKASRVK